MPNNRLILRTLTSPWVTPVGDITKNSVLTHDDVDNNFIYLRGETLYNIELDAATLKMNKVNGTNYEFDFSVLSNGIFTGGTVVGETEFDAPLSACTYPVYLNDVFPCPNNTGINFNGSISATTFYGDGSNLTGISGGGGIVTGDTIYLGTVTFVNNVFSSSAITVNNLTVTGDTIFNDNTTFTSAVTINNLTVTGDTIFNDNTTFTSAVTINNLTVTGDSIFNNTTTFTSAVTINNLAVTGTTTFSGAISACTEPIYLSTIEGCNGNVININDIISATTISATTYYGDGSNLTGISGGDTFTGGTITGETTFTNNISLTSGVTINNLAVTGTTTFSGAISACTEPIYLSTIEGCNGGTININDNILATTISATTYYGDGSNLTGILTNSGGVVSGNTTFTSDVAINNLTVTGDTVFTGPVSACTSGITTNDIYTCSSGLTIHSNVTYVGQANNPLYNNGSGNTFTLDFDNSNIQTITLTGNTSIVNPLNVKEGASYTVIIKQGPSGPYTINSWGSNFKFESGTYPALSTGTTNVDIITFISDDESNLYGIGAYDFF